MDADEIVEELNKLKMYNPEEYRKKLALIKVKDPFLYSQVAKMMGLDSNNSQPTIINKPSKKSAPKKIIRGTPTIGIVIVVTLIIGFIIVGSIILFITTIPTTTSSSFNATESVMVGYTLFNSLNTTYLQYSFENNISQSGSVSNTIGREYYIIENADFISALYYNKYNCNPSCEINTQDGYDISSKINDVINYGVFSSCTTCSCNNNEFDNLGTLNFYDELYYYVTSDLVLNSSREDVWTINNEQCAPMYFDINPPIGLTGLRYELCLNNDGIPLALGKVSIYETKTDLFIAFLESNNANLLGSTTIEDKTLNEWKEEELSCN